MSKMMKALYFGNFPSAIVVFSKVAAEGGCLHCIAFNKAVRQARVADLDQAISLVKVTEKLPEVVGSKDRVPALHEDQVFIEVREGDKIVFMSSQGTEIV